MSQCAVKQLCWALHLAFCRDLSQFRIDRAYDLKRLLNVLILSCVCEMQTKLPLHLAHKLGPDL